MANTPYPQSYYAASANPVPPRPALQGEVETDVCIIGAGYTGLSSALFLAEAGYSVTVLEAAKVGFGASGRNGGQLVNSYSRDVDVIEQRYGEKTAEVLGSMIFEGADIIRSRIKQYDIKCDYKPGGIFAALNKKQLKGLAEQSRQPRWNFFKYVVDRQGKVVASFSSLTKPDDPELIAAVEKAIASQP